jgi:hypothetical protein
MSDTAPWRRPTQSERLDNAWIRGADNAVLKVMCHAGARPRLVAIVTVWPGEGYLLHNGPGVGWPLEDGRTLRVACAACRPGHRLDHSLVRAVLDGSPAPRTVRVEQVCVGAAG